MTNEVYSKQITPEEVQAAYKQTGLTPLSGTFYRDDAVNRQLCGCPLTALYLAAGNELPTGKASCYTGNGAVTDWACRMYGAEYVGGFVSGVDGDTGYWHWLSRSERYRQGESDGRRAGCRVGVLDQFGTPVKVPEPMCD